MSEPITTLAVDYGTRRVGLAVADPLGVAVTPLEVAQVTTPAQAVAAAARAADDRGAGRVVVGLPLNMDGSEGPSAAAVREFARDLAAACGLPIVLVDERLSSFEAESRLIERKRGGERMTRKSKKRRLDAAAAAVILEGYLSGGLRAVDTVSA